MSTQANMKFFSLRRTYFSKPRIYRVHPPSKKTHVLSTLTDGGGGKLPPKNARIVFGGDEPNNNNNDNYDVIVLTFLSIIIGFSFTVIMTGGQSSYNDARYAQYTQSNDNRTKLFYNRDIWACWTI